MRVLLTAQPKKSALSMARSKMARSDGMQAVANRYVDAKKYAGIEWQVDVAGETYLKGQAGVADAQTGRVIPDGAIYRIYSMTKPVVSFLALQLIEQGKLRLYDMLAQYDPRFAQLRVLTADGAIEPLLRAITVEDLLTHRAGFTYDFIPGCHISAYYREAEIIGNAQRSLDDMMGALAELPIAFQPGSKWRYSVCTDVLAHVCERAGGDTLDNLLKTNIFDPLGMRDTAFHVADGEEDRLMPMYGVGDLRALPKLELVPQTLDPMSVDDMHPVGPTTTFRRGGHGLYSTLNDYAAFARMLVNGKAEDGAILLSSTMLETLQANRIPAEMLPLSIGPNVFAGYGWGLLGRVMLDQGQSMGLTGVGEFGWAGAASTYFWVDPGRSMSGVVMTQYLGASLPLADDMRTAAYQAF